MVKSVNCRAFARAFLSNSDSYLTSRYIWGPSLDFSLNHNCIILLSSCFVEPLSNMIFHPDNKTET